MAFQAKSDIVSSDVVGYLQQNLTPGVKTVNGTPFVVIGENESFKLTDLIPMDGRIARIAEGVYIELQKKILL